jgi:hypothetical protein
MTPLAMYWSSSDVGCPVEGAAGAAAVGAGAGGAAAGSSSFSSWAISCGSERPECIHPQ